MKKYYTPDIDIITLHTNDIMNASKTIGEAGENASGYEDHGDLASVFNLSV